MADLLMPTEGFVASLTTVQLARTIRFAASSGRDKEFLRAMFMQAEMCADELERRAND